MIQKSGFEEYRTEKNLRFFVIEIPAKLEKKTPKSFFFEDVFLSEVCVCVAETLAERDMAPPVVTAIQICR
jgi:hypothetical protein